MLAMQLYQILRQIHPHSQVKSVLVVKSATQKCEPCDDINVTICEVCEINDVSLSTVLEDYRRISDHAACSPAGSGSHVAKQQ